MFNGLCFESERYGGCSDLIEGGSVLRLDEMEFDIDVTFTDNVEAGLLNLEGEIQMGILYMLLVANVVWTFV